MTNEAGDATVVEPRTAVREYAGRWVRGEIDREELARLRRIKKWPIHGLCAHFEYSQTKIKKELRRLSPRLS